ncbi:hypothetical protein GCM10009854_29330 [Saccharopolyspora halophila]|uniref:Uncharacterized protein n=1 Tax=Saccharopolyspora halophila TaxID=405551 RepID=A0ABP5TCM0_9PSEU
MAPDPTAGPAPAPKPVIDWRADWRRAHWGLYVLPGMAIVVSVLLLVDDVSPTRLLSALVGILSIVVNFCGGRVVKPWQVFVLLPGTVALAFVAFWLTGLG